MSYRAIAAALELRELSTGERLVAFSLASYANSDRQAWPNNEVAAAELDWCAAVTSQPAGRRPSAG
ncbi:MAG: hypothetical protein WAL22_03450 [Solirubrobacteraceae bacterium]